MSCCIDSGIHSIEYWNIDTFHTLPLCSIIVEHQYALSWFDA